MRTLFTQLAIALLFVLPAAWPTCAQTQPDSPAAQGQGPGGRMRGGQGGGPAIFGKIAAINGNSSVDITTQDGGTVTVKLTNQTQFHQGRDQAKLSDFKVGDTVIVRGQQNSDHSWTAERFGTRPNMGPGGPGAGGGGGRGPGGGFAGGTPQGTLGTDFVAGEVKSIDAPSMVILRTDNVTQTIELNEETSMRKGRDSVTMADVKVGDHVVARGALENNVFVPKNLMVVDPAQWQRMQQRPPAGGQGQAPPLGAPPSPKPTEPQN